MATPKGNKRAQHPPYYFLIGLLSVMRGYNILMVVIAQYLSSIFVFNVNESVTAVIFDVDLFLTVISTSLVIAAGYIINDFYDTELDRINKPLKYRIDNFVPQGLKLKIYFLCNAIGFLLSFVVSWRAALFFASYIFLIWLYSHKLKKRPWVGLVSASSLAMMPFFVIFVYHKYISELIFIHAAFLFFILFVRELVKDLENIQGAFAMNYRKIPVIYGEKVTKRIITILVFFALNPVYLLLGYPEIGAMKYYFYLVFFSLFIFLLMLWKVQSKKAYGFLHSILKFLIVLGVFSLSLIDTSVLISRILEKI
jgi:4-hydroxybenzoate polyprenyltransferase